MLCTDFYGNRTAEERIRSSSNQGGLPVGALIGIIVAGVLLLFVIVGFSLFFLYWRRRRASTPRENQLDRSISLKRMGVKNLKNVEILECIGRGSFGEVYRGKWMDSNVALKGIFESQIQAVKREAIMLW